MKRLRMEVLGDSRLAITFIVIDGERFGQMFLVEQKKARVASKELASGKSMSNERRAELERIAVPLKPQKNVYPDFESAFRAMGHILEKQQDERFRILELIYGIKKINSRMNYEKGSGGDKELEAKIAELGQVVEKLEGRNSVFLVDGHASLASGIIPEAIGLIRSGKWYIACTKLVQSVNVLNEKLEHQGGPVASKAFARARIIMDLIEIRDSWETLSKIAGQLRESAKIKENMEAKLEKALWAIDSGFRVGMDRFEGA
ncbi:MAG: hypothetical protein ABIF01_02535, partial [Candidatus Micrarchaeota archaeon]